MHEDLEPINDAINRASHAIDEGRATINLGAFDVEDGGTLYYNAGILARKLQMMQRCLHPNDGEPMVDDGVDHTEEVLGYLGEQTREV